MKRDYAAFGFDQIDIDISDLSSTNIEYLEYGCNESLEGYKGVIIPQGIFEDLKESGVRYAKEYLLIREREIYNLIKNGGWVCFLIDEIHDTLEYLFDFNECRDTDLCKKIMNELRVHREIGQGNPYLEHKSNEFAKYLELNGVGKTFFYKTEGINVLIHAKGEAYGIEARNSFFFLPFQHSALLSSNLTNVLEVTLNCIENYKKKNELRLPQWLQDKVFSSENSLENELELLIHKQEELINEIEKLKRYKAILTSSGEKLKDLTGEILRDYFDLKVDLIDTGREDLKILDDENNVLYFVEVKGTSRGLKREHINQLDSHRERANVSSDIKGLLVINTEMNKEGYDTRSRNNFEDQHINRAINSNIVILRTIDLLNLMLKLENEENRNKKFIEFIENTKGWNEV